MQAFFERMALAMWGPFTMAAIIIIGLFLAVKTRFYYILNAPKALFKLLRKRDSKSKISPFMALSNALGATMGTGNIVGVATAVAAGGAGALVWMQLSALAGMMIKFAEVKLAVKYRSRGIGPMGYLSTLGRLGAILSPIFAVSCVAASLLTGNMTQSNSSAQALELFSVSPPVSAAIFGVVTWAATGRGVRGMMKASSFIVPVITVGYIAMAAAAIFSLRDNLPMALKEMLQGALGFKAAVGGFAGHSMLCAMRYGLARGIFSNEAGMGTSPIAYSLSDSAKPDEQGMMGIAEVFIDTVICCTLTGLVLLVSNCTDAQLDGAKLAATGFAYALGEGAGIITAAFIALFGITSVCGWYIYGKKSLEYLFNDGNLLQKLYRVLYIAGAAAGVFLSPKTIWLVSDLMTGVMFSINFLGLCFLLKEVK